MESEWNDPSFRTDPVFALPDECSECQLRRLKGPQQLLGKEFGPPSGGRLVVEAGKVLKAAADGVQRSQEVGRSGVILADDEIDVGQVLPRERAEDCDIFEPHVFKHDRVASRGHQSREFEKAESNDYRDPNSTGEVPYPRHGSSFGRGCE